MHNVIVLIFSKAVVQMYPVEYGFLFMPIYFNSFQSQYSISKFSENIRKASGFLMFSGGVEIEPGLKLFKFDLSANYFSRNYQKVSEKHFFLSTSN